jgi:hypothetical protein
MISEALTLKRHNLQDVMEEFKSKFDPIAVKNCSIPRHNVYAYILEEYFFRVNSTLAAFVIFEQKQNSEIEVTLAVAGGGAGMLDLTWGAENRELKDLKTFFEKKM